ncbi:probable protein S-acyltransferase 22 [Cucurbita moschata]|uniref:S-acyltransferase n=1 Tax=Cucurbita moschata TaxID=3662 RepID=A0A6J1GZ84_CUCMO|nr:probable protein S-acyltransferase 22 [Cucurbita moschata]
MRKHGWQLPYHPLQVVAVAVFLALGFAFYVFFAPFVGTKVFQYVMIGLYTPLITCVFGLYIWCAAADPADSGVFKSKKYVDIPDEGKCSQQKSSKLGGASVISTRDPNAVSMEERSVGKDTTGGADANSKDLLQNENDSPASKKLSCLSLACFPCAYVCNCLSPKEESSEQHMSEDGMFYCSLCEVEVFKYSKHCRVCDKCVDRFDHHCRWLNNCIGRKNYRQFFTLMVTSLLLLIVQWSSGILVLICCVVEKKRFSVEISLKLGSSFSLAPFIVVVAVCTILAMIATLPLAQLFFFHILLIKKGITTYDYIIALREQEQEQQGVGGQQSPQMSVVSSLTGLSSASSFSTLHRGAWCTPPRLFLEDQFDVIPPETGSVSSLGKRTVSEEATKKKNPAAVRISPWTLARLNADEVSKAAAEARKKSKILQPVVRSATPFERETDSGFGSSSHRMVSRPENNRRRGNKRVRLPADLPMQRVTNIPAKAVEKGFSGTSTSLGPLQLEARSAFQTSRAMSSSTMVASSPESSLDSPDIHPFRISSSGAEESKRLTGLSAANAAAALKGLPLSRSTSDGYEASGGEDSDRVPSRIVQRPTTWNNILYGSDQDERLAQLQASSSNQINRKHTPL